MASRRLQHGGCPLRSVTWKGGAPPEGSFPFDVPAVRSLGALDLDAPVTFFVGENGSGKSTLLEGIAAASGLPTVGATETARDPSLDAQRRLGRALRLVWSARRTRGFFLRAEDFFGFQKRLARERTEFHERLDQLAAEYRDRSDYARALAEGPARASLADMRRRYGDDPDAASHGQAFLRLFQSRFVPGGLHLLDEPEVPLSPQNQLGLVAMLLQMTSGGAQFIIATHSPILLACPGARIYSFDRSPVAAVEYESLDHVTITRDFLNDPARFLRRLTGD